MTRSAPLLAVAALLAAPTAFAADAANGKAVFEKNACNICHVVSDEPGPATGPSLVGVVGRKAATVKDFAMYTDALKKSNLTWNAKNLDEFLAGPMTKVPGTMMLIPVTDAKERADLIAYLTTLKGK
ncbi:MAG TPA: c-type cytochrome [Steroidobacteraceae bacterium]|nr:c-type cytochrome [Steroidobacteraceae bacterium]